MMCCEIIRGAILGEMTRESFPEEADRDMNVIQGDGSWSKLVKVYQTKETAFPRSWGRPGKSTSVERLGNSKGHASCVREFELLQEDSDDSSKGL